MKRTGPSNPLGYYLTIFTAFSSLALFGCDSNNTNNCLSVSPNEAYTITGNAGTMNFAPASKTFTVRNICDYDIILAVDEDERWLDVEIDAYDPAERGPLAASATVSVRIEVRYGSDNPERLDQLSAGDYDTDIRFIGESDNGELFRQVDLTVSP